MNERRTLIYIFGSVEENGTWRRRYNHELYKLFNDPNIIGYIKVMSLEWAGHLTRASENRIIKKIFNTKPEGTRKVGRTKLKCGECVCQDIRILGAKELEECGTEKGRRVNNFEEGQGSQRAVMPVMMLMMMMMMSRQTCIYF
jgi:hypothetical protein